MVTPQPGVWAWAAGAGGCNHFRQLEPLRVAASLGIGVGNGHVLSDTILEAFDTLLVHQINQPNATEAWQKLARSGTHRMIIDVDDNMWEPDFQPFRLAYTEDAIARLESNLRVAHVVTTPSPVLAEKLTQFNANVWVVPNTVPEWLLDWNPNLTRYDRRTGRQRGFIGWQGSGHHRLSMTQPIIDQIGRFMGANPNWDWRIYGGHRVVAAHMQHRIHHIPWEDDLTLYYRSLAFDIGIGPMQRTPFTAAKSSLRAVEYAALGIPAVLADEPPYRGWVTPEMTGFLIDPDRPGDWFEALDFLAKHPETRREMGDLARLRAREWTTEAAIMAWVEAWDSVTETRTDNVVWLPKKGPTP